MTRHNIDADPDKADWPKQGRHDAVRAQEARKAAERVPGHEVEIVAVRELRKVLVACSCGWSSWTLTKAGAHYRKLAHWRSILPDDPS